MSKKKRLLIDLERQWYVEDVCTLEECVEAIDLLEIATERIDHDMKLYLEMRTKGILDSAMTDDWFSRAKTSFVYKKIALSRVREIKRNLVRKRNLDLFHLASGKHREFFHFVRGVVGEGQMSSWLEEFKRATEQKPSPDS